MAFLFDNVMSASFKEDGRYRNREKHLKIFIEEFVPILRKHIPDVKVTIIEQSNDQRLFNRGKLLSAGIMEQCILDECSDSSRIVLHDIDTFGNDSCVVSRVCSFRTV